MTPGCLQSEDRRPKTEDRRPKTEDRRPKTEDRRPKTEDRRPKTEDQKTKTSLKKIMRRQSEDHRVNALLRAKKHEIERVLVL